jgi:hypothetical protein
MRLDRQELEAALSLLLDQMEGEQGPSHEVYLRLVQLLDAMRATGMPLPDDLVALERDLAAEFESDARRPKGKRAGGPKSKVRAAVKSSGPGRS